MTASRQATEDLATEDLATEDLATEDLDISGERAQDHLPEDLRIMRRRDPPRLLTTASLHEQLA
ncbi:hypothetical protein [Mesorhizobium sp.]|uniref:hypothetical protein n=1 Tax=Mesorhizobium sp. TaxID=1871066 RepID=UPI00257F66D8|nr:hypothetical protein [Mesorhizobium sp.]